jgi:hypothetical protein
MEEDQRLLGREKYAHVPKNMRRMERSPSGHFFIQPLHYEPSHDVILSEAKNLGLQLNESSSRGTDRDVSLSLNMTPLFARWSKQTSAYS